MSAPRGTAWKLLALAALWLAALAACTLIGGQRLDLAAALAGDGAAARILWEIRLPRVLLALVAGGALAVAGVGFQGLFRNPLAEPYTLGVASGAALGVSLALHLLPAGAALALPVQGAASFAGALAVSALILGLAARRPASDTATLLLAGIAVALTCSALVLFLQYLADYTQTFRMVRWMMGGLAVVGYGDLLWALPWVAGGTAALLLLRWQLDLLLLGEETAAARGADLARLRLAVLGAVSLMVGALVAVTGPIGFVGLIVPHILRRLVGHGHLALLPAAFLGGGAFLALCDLAARTVMAPAELPVGVLTALLGGPFFIWLLVRRA